MRNQDYYSVLGVVRSASGDEIKRAYRRLARRFHPDVSADPDGQRKFQAVAEAYRTLRRIDTRSAYDRRALPVLAGDACWPANPLEAWCALFQWTAWGWMWPG